MLELSHAEKQSIPLRTLKYAQALGDTETTWDSAWTQQVSGELDSWQTQIYISERSNLCALHDWRAQIVKLGAKCSRNVFCECCLFIILFLRATKGKCLLFLRWCLLFSFYHKYIYSHVCTLCRRPLLGKTCSAFLFSDFVEEIIGKT
jgi:hypothetical protein